MNGSSIIGSGAITVDGSTPVSPGQDWHIVETGDFNGDNKTDILWRNDNGQLAEWLMNNGLITSSFTPNVNGVNISPDTTWHIQSKPTNYA